MFAVFPFYAGGLTVYVWNLLAYGPLRPLRPVFSQPLPLKTTVRQNFETTCQVTTKATKGLKNLHA